MSDDDPLDFMRAAYVVSCQPKSSALYIGDRDVFMQWMKRGGVPIYPAKPNRPILAETMFGIPIRVDGKMPVNMIQIVSGNDVQTMLIEDGA